MSNPTEPAPKKIDDAILAATCDAGHLATVLLYKPLCEPEPATTDSDQLRTCKAGSIGLLENKPQRLRLSATNQLKRPGVRATALCRSGVTSQAYSENLTV